MKLRSSVQFNLLWSLSLRNVVGADMARTGTWAAGHLRTRWDVRVIDIALEQSPKVVRGKSFVAMKANNTPKQD